MACPLEQIVIPETETRETGDFRPWELGHIYFTGTEGKVQQSLFTINGWLRAWLQM